MMCLAATWYEWIVPYMVVLLIVLGAFAVGSSGED